MYEDLKSPYQVNDLPYLQIGSIEVAGETLAEGPIQLVLKSLNRHGLIAGATGSGKTKTMQVLAEQLSLQGVPSLVMDIKGDISGLAMAGLASDKLNDRSRLLGLEFKPQNFPVELYSLGGGQAGIPLRATVRDFGPLLFSRMLDLNETQSGVVTVLFEYAKVNSLDLINLDDFKALLQFAQSDKGKAVIEAQFGGVSSASLGTIARKIIELEAQGGQQFFGEPAFSVQDLLLTNAQGRGLISILRLTDMQDKPKLFSSFMLKLLSDIYREMPELGDPDKPKLILFIDEAHLIFNNASKALLNLIDTMVKLIRSKGVGLIFCTQTPNDIPESVLSQLGLKIQHVLRAFTAKDRKAMKLVAQNFPASSYYNTEQLLTELGIGEALISALDAKGQPTPLVQGMIRAPESRMGILTDAELADLLSRSSFYQKYKTPIDPLSAKEKLSQQASSQAESQTSKEEGKTSAQKGKPEPSVINELSKNTLIRQLVRQFFRQMTNMLLAVFKTKK